MSLFKDVFKDYFNSFKVKSDFLYTLIVDAVLVAAVVIIFSLIVAPLNEQAQEISGGRTPTALQSYLLSLPQQELQEYAGELRAFTIKLISALILLPIFVFLLYSFEQAVVWSLINKKEFNFRQHWKWNLVNVVLLLIFTAFLIGYLIIGRLILVFVDNVITGNFVNGLIMLLFFTAFLLIAFLSYNSFVETRMVWSSVGSAFRKIKVNFKNVAAVYLFAFLTIVVLQLVQIPLRNYYFVYPNVSLYVNVALFVLWAAWFRMYAVKIIGIS